MAKGGRQIENRNDILHKVLDRLAALESDVHALKQWKDDVITDIDRFLAKDWVQLQKWMGNIENGIHDLRPLLLLLEQNEELTQEVKKVKTRLEAVERIKDRIKERFESQSRWRTWIGKSIITAFVTLIILAMIELFKIVLR